MTALRFACPHCDHLYVDGFELLAAGDELAAFQCEQCHAPFSLLLVECPRCGAEDSTTWASIAAASPPGACRECGHARGCGDFGDESVW